MKRIVLFLCAMSLLGCMGETIDKNRAVATMDAAGFKDIRVTGQHGVAPSWNGCSESDAVAFDVSATNPAGKRVTATVCCGWGLVAEKGCTIRH